MSVWIGRITTSLVAIALYAIITRYAWPMFRDKALYNGVRIAGTWDIVEERNGEEVTAGQIVLKQTSSSVKGESVRSKRRDGAKSNRQFEYEGKISGNQLTLLFEDKSGKGFDTGSYIFVVQNDGLTMAGRATFHGKPENGIVSEPRTLRKVAA